MLSSLLLTVVLSVAPYPVDTPQEHQLKNVLTPKTVELTRLDRGNHTVQARLRPVLQAERNVSLVVPNTADGLVKLGNTLKTRERLKPVLLGANRKFHVYLVPFEDLKEVDKLKELAKENKMVQMYPTFIDSPFVINGKVLVNVKLLQKEKLENFVKEHKLQMESIVENNIFGTYFLNVTDESNLLDVFEVLAEVENKDWIDRASLDLPLVPLR